MMTKEQINAESHFYRWLCYKKYKDHYTTCQSIEAYTQEQRDQAAAETAHFMEKHRLPVWATIIQRVEVHHDNTIIFIHHDPNHIH